MSYLDELIKHQEGDTSNYEASLLNRFNEVVKAFPSAQDDLSKVEEAITFEQKVTAYESAAKSNLLMHFQSGTDSALLHIKTPFWNKPTTATMKIEWDGDSGKIIPTDIVTAHYPVLASKLSQDGFVGADSVRVSLLSESVAVRVYLYSVSSFTVVTAVEVMVGVLLVFATLMVNDCVSTAPLPSIAFKTTS